MLFDTHPHAASSTNHHLYRYEDIEYKSLDAQFHAFEMDDCVGGFSFCSKDEAPKFLSKVNALKPSSKNNAVDALKGTKKEKKGLFGSKPKKKEISGPVVSGVLNVVHTQHIGMNTDGSFDLDNISPEWKALFRQAGIKKKDLANPETAKAIVQTIAATTGMKITTLQNNQQNHAAKEAHNLNVTSDEAKQQYTPDQLREIEDYQAALKKYEDDLAAYEAEQSALSAWERDNSKYLAEKEVKDKEERAARERVEKEEGERRYAANAVEELKQLTEQQRLLELELVEKEKVLKDAEAKGAKLPPPPPPRKQAAAKQSTENAPPPPPRRKTSVVQSVVRAVTGSNPEEERRKRDEEFERLRKEEENMMLTERARIRAEIEAEIRADEEEFRKTAIEERRKMKEEAEREQQELMAQINAAKTAAEKSRMEEAARFAAQQAETARREQEELERKAADDREKTRHAAEQAQREQEDILRQLQVMQEKTMEARRLMDEEAKRQEELRKEAMKKKAPPLPARLPDKPPLPPPPAAPPRPPMAPKLPPMTSPSAMAPGGTAPKAGGASLSGVLKGLGTVELKRTEVVDKSVPNITGKGGRDEKKNAFLGALEKGVQLKKVENEQKSTLPQLERLDTGVQSNIMQKLVETMNVRRGALHGDDSDDDWSD